MRSVNRGPWPTDEDGRRISYREDRTRELLTKRIGRYCSYCERSTDLALEHVVPKSIARDLETEWCNLLLACRNCNSCKSNSNHSRDGYLWPDRDNTFSAYEYQSDGRVSVNRELAEGEHRKALALFDLVGLGNSETHSNERDRLRRQAWKTAKQFHEFVLRHPNSDDRELVVQVALDIGFFSVWMTVFHDDEDMRRRLIEAFPGTRA